MTHFHQFATYCKAVTTRKIERLFYLKSIWLNSVT